MSSVEPPREVVEEELQRVLAWPGLVRSPQLAKFLNYVVRAKLDGDDANIKAYSIAVDVFGRPATFDPQADPIVRVQARRLRALLDEYYADVGADRTLRFSLPVGRYAPDFVRVDRPAAQGEVAELTRPVSDGVATPPSSTSSPAPLTTLPDVPAPTVPRRRLGWVGEATILLGALIAINIVVILIGTVVLPHMPRTDVPGAPTVAISEFTVLADQGQTIETDVAGLAVELVTDLQQFDSIVPSYLPAALPADGMRSTAQYILTGIARREGSREQVTASLKRAGSDAVLWTETVTPSTPRRSGDVDEVSRAFAVQLGSTRGPLHAEAMAWLDTHELADGQGTEYLCRLLFARYRDSGQTEAADRARACIDDLLRREGELAAPQAMGAMLTVEAMLLDRAPGALDPEVLAEATRRIEVALQDAPTSSLIWEQDARLLEIAGKRPEAEAAYASALQLNPASLDVIAAYGRMLVLAGSSEKGEALMRQALNSAIDPPPWYHAAKAISAFRRRDYVEAISSAERLVAGDAELGSVIATVSSRRIGSSQTLNRYFAQMLDVTRFRRFGILPVLRQRIGDSGLLDEIASDLAAAGVSAAALNGMF